VNTLKFDQEFSLICGMQVMRFPFWLNMKYPRAQRKHEVVTFPAHHQGIPLGARRADGKILAHLRQRAPVVEKRSLLAYESAANGGGR
jgi:hypothetical protein